MGSSLNKPIEEITTLTKNQSNSANVYDDFIENLIKSNKIVVFSKTNCSYCRRAKSTLNDLNLEYRSIELDINQQCPNDNCQKLTTALVLQTRMKTVPQIFVNGKLIGGFTDLELIVRDTDKFKELFSSNNK